MNFYAGAIHVASSRQGLVEYYHVDHLGSTRLKTSSCGSVVYSSDYEPYGPGCGESGSEEYRYTGKREDPTGLYYFGARYYDPVTGRFTTRDTVMGDLSDPQSLNRYSYCRNNPQKFTDPDGNVYVEAIMIGAIGGACFGAIFSTVDYLFNTPRTEWDAGTAVGKFVAGGLTGGAVGAAITAKLPLLVIGGIPATAYSTGRLIEHTYQYESGALEPITDPVEYTQDWTLDVGTKTAATIVYATKSVRYGLGIINSPISKKSASLGYITGKTLGRVSKSGYVSALKTTINMIRNEYSTWSSNEQKNYWDSYDEMESRNKR